MTPEKLNIGDWLINRNRDQIQIEGIAKATSSQEAEVLTGGCWFPLSWFTPVPDVIRKHSKTIEMLIDYSMWLEKNGYMDIDWRVERPYAIDEFLKERRDS